MKVKPSEIEVGSRAREDVDNIGKLTDSIKRLGLLQRIGITEDKELVYGLRRLEAWKNAMGDKPIPVEIVEPEDEKERRMMELAENVRRLNLSWQEEAELVAEIDRLGREIHGEQPRGGDQGKTPQNLRSFGARRRRHGC